MAPKIHSKTYFKNRKKVLKNLKQFLVLWKFFKPLFTRKIKNFKGKIMLVENEKVVSTNEEIAYLFNTNFNDIIKVLNTERQQCSNLPCEDPLVNAIRKNETNPSILKIKSIFTSIRLFDFSFVSSDDISKIITSPWI